MGKGVKRTKRLLCDVSQQNCKNSLPSQPKTKRKKIKTSEPMSDTTEGIDSNPHMSKTECDNDTTCSEMAKDNATLDLPLSQCPPPLLSQSGKLIPKFTAKKKLRDSMSSLKQDPPASFTEDLHLHVDAERLSLSEINREPVTKALCPITNDVDRSAVESCAEKVKETNVNENDGAADHSASLSGQDCSAVGGKFDNLAEDEYKLKLPVLPEISDTKGNSQCDDKDDNGNGGAAVSVEAADDFAAIVSGSSDVNVEGSENVERPHTVKCSAVSMETTGSLTAGNEQLSADCHNLQIKKTADGDAVISYPSKKATEICVPDVPGSIALEDSSKPAETVLEYDRNRTAAMTGVLLDATKLQSADVLTDETCVTASDNVAGSDADITVGRDKQQSEEQVDECNNGLESNKPAEVPASDTCGHGLTEEAQDPVDAAVHPDGSTEFREIRDASDGMPAFDDCLDITDSQLCQLDDDDFSDGPINAVNFVRPFIDAPTVAQRQRNDGRRLVNRLITELRSINSRMIRFRQEMDRIKHRQTTYH